MRRRVLQISQGRAGDPDQLAVELNALGPSAGELDRPGPLLCGAAMIAPGAAGASQGIRLLQQTDHHPHRVP